MKITYPTKQRWYKSVVQDPLSQYGKKNQKRIRATVSREDSSHITHTFEKLSTDFLDWFTPYYTKIIGSKNNAIVHDLYKATLGNEKRISEYWALTIFENNVKIGASIIGIRAERIMIAFKAHEPRWQSTSLQSTPSLYSDYVACTYAYELKKDFISHGQDRNLYGMNSSIGLAAFKLSTGYHPCLLEKSEAYETEIIDTTNIHLDTLVLEHPIEGDKIKKAYLFTTPENETKYTQITQYPKLLKVEVIHI